MPYDKQQAIMTAAYRPIFLYLGWDGIINLEKTDKNEEIYVGSEFVDEEIHINLELFNAEN